MGSSIFDTVSYIGNPAINFFGLYKLIQKKGQKMGKSVKSPKIDRCNELPVCIIEQVTKMRVCLFLVI